MKLLNDYLKESYGCKVYKLSLQAKVTGMEHWEVMAVFFVQQEALEILQLIELNLSQNSLMGPADVVAPNHCLLHPYGLVIKRG